MASRVTQVWSVPHADVDFGKARIDFHRYEFPNQ